MELTSHTHRESDCQAQVVAWLELLKNQTKRLSYTAFPAECFQMKMFGKAKKMGFRSGWPDLMIFVEGPKIGLFELKMQDGELKDHQRLLHNELRDLGFAVYVVRAETPNQMTENIARILRDDFGFKEAKI